MKKYKVNELREMFLSFFEEKGHLRLPSFPVVPKDDPSLLLIGSGMAPMKPWFTGEVEPPSKRVCTCQKCIRTVDIENVGKTSRHGTYFEMLGNFSFGDYFKSETLAWNWEFLTKRLDISPDLLYPSVYFEDDETFEIWEKEIGIAPERIIRLGREDNFWDHGSGPCGPCSEIYFDRGISNGCGSPDCKPGCECDRFIEVQNNVFTQFSNDGEGNYSELSQKNIDMGMGLERLAIVCQGADNIFEIDTLISIINKITEISGVTYKSDDKSDVSIRVIADHIRSSVMMINDGVLPSNEGRGYVLRRLIRRALRHGQLLGITDMFLSDISDVVIDINKSAYPDLIERAAYINRIISVEEENFNKTISSGAVKLKELIGEYTKRGDKFLSGADAFKLYDTYGFPVDLTKEILEEHNMEVDDKSFHEHMQEQRTRARKAREALGDLAWAGIDLGLDNTPTEFVDTYESPGSILAIVAENELSSSVSEGSSGIVILDKTPFYAEKGGQSADKGILCVNDDVVFEVYDVKLQGEKYLHHGKMTKGTFSVDDSVISKIDKNNRRAVMRAHSAAHILQAALIDVLGDHITQAGSMVDADKVRFDFTHFSALTRDEIVKVQKFVNDAILDDFIISASEMALNDAKTLGATALFGEKYGDIVRVVEIGSGSRMGGHCSPEASSGCEPCLPCLPETISIELCGGTHLSNTAKIGAFNITAEFSVAAGVRRIEATTGKATLETLNHTQENLSRIAALVKANSPDEIPDRFEQNLNSMRELKMKLDAAIKKESQSEAARMLTDSQEIGGLRVIAAVIDDTDVDADKLRQIEGTLRELDQSIVAVLAISKDDKITIAATSGDEAIKKGIKAGELIKEITKICGGSGGGKPEFAMGGGKDPAKLHEAMQTVPEYVKRFVNA